MTEVVVDASLLSGAWIASQQVAGAEEVLLGASRLFGPPLLRLEFRNAIYRLERRGILAQEEVERLREQFEAAHMSIVDSPAWLDRAMALARRFKQPAVYDAIYLACAEDLGADLWTCDARFVRSFGIQRPARLRLCPDDVGVG